MKVNIQFNRFLDPVFAVYSKTLYPEWEQPSHAEVLERVRAYKKEWKTREKDLMFWLEGILGAFIRPTIDVHIVSGNPRPFSNPIVLKSGYDPKEFVQVLTHELIHVLLNDLKWPNVETMLYPNENPTVQRHVLVYAVLMRLGFNPAETSPDYARALMIARARGAEQVIAEYKKAALERAAN